MRRLLPSTKPLEVGVKDAGKDDTNGTYMQAHGHWLTAGGKAAHCLIKGAHEY